MSKKRFAKDKVFFLNPKSCGIYKSGGTRFKVDEHGRRTAAIDNELSDQVDAFLAGKCSPGEATIKSKDAFKTALVPRYFDTRWDQAFNDFVRASGIEAVSIGQLLDSQVLTVRGGHGSPGNDQRIGTVPYVKVSDIRNLRMNINPTNMIPEGLAKRFWRSPSGDSGLRAWDVLTPNRASSNIGEFAIILPGEERVVLTKEMFVFRVGGGIEDGWDPFYLLWALCLKAVRIQWQRVTFMQTNREDVGDRYREVRLPKPKSKEWARQVSAPFRTYFECVAEAKRQFHQAAKESTFSYIASVFADLPVPERPSNGDGVMVEGTDTAVAI